jgi:PRTRC genetic system protein A
MEEKVISLTELKENLVDYHIGVPDEGFCKPVNYVMTAEGVHYIRNTGLGFFVLKTDKVPGLPKIKSGLNLTIPKIPFELICQCYSFFKAIYDRDNTEASALIFFNPETQEHFIHIPEQKNTASSSDFTEDPDTPLLREKMVPVMELHSHAGMSAFWSGTDNQNEKREQTYMVMGDMSKKEISYKVRLSCAGVQEDIDIWEIVEKPEIYMTVGKKKIKMSIPSAIKNFPTFDIPEEWETKVKKYTVVSPITKSKTMSYGGTTIHRPERKIEWYEHPSKKK